MNRQFPLTRATYREKFAEMRIAVMRPLGKPAAKRKVAKKAKSK